MIRSLKLRRTVIVVGVVASLLVGLLSIEIAAALTAAAAPPPAPPMSLSALQDALAAQQQRGDELESQLAEMNDLTASLAAALAGTQDHISTQGKTAKELEKELKTAQAKLAKMQGLLNQAQARLAALRAAANGVAGGGGGGGGGGGSAPKATPRPAPAGGGGTGGGSTTPGLTLALSGGGVRADWSACSVSGFAAYALVRSTDPEIHYPPEDRDTEVAHVTSASTTAATDAAAPSGSMTYKVYCLIVVDHETKVAGASAARQISVP
jgi:hypothetical protein